jgi:hypothetical protein
MGEIEINHIATGRPSLTGENYLILIMGVSNSDEDGGGVDGDGSGGNSPSQQGAGIETFCPPDIVCDGGGATKLF